jgi:site-specific recombinase XerD
LPKLLSAEEVRQLLEAPDVESRKARDRAMLELLCCGLRVSELASLPLANSGWPTASSRPRERLERKRVVPVADASAGGWPAT